MDQDELNNEAEVTAAYPFFARYAVERGARTREQMAALAPEFLEWWRSRTRQSPYRPTSPTTALTLAAGGGYRSRRVSRAGRRASSRRRSPRFW